MAAFLFVFTGDCMTSCLYGPPARKIILNLSRNNCHLIILLSYLWFCSAEWCLERCSGSLGWGKVGWPLWLLSQSHLESGRMGTLQTVRCGMNRDVASGLQSLSFSPCWRHQKMKKMQCIKSWDKHKEKKKKQSVVGSCSQNWRRKYLRDIYISRLGYADNTYKMNVITLTNLYLL